MKFVSDPAIAIKIAKMKERVRWQDPLIAQRNIDQTSFVLDDGQDSPEFSFLVIGDSGSGSHRGADPQRQVMELMLPHREDCRFLLHTGDVVYLVGSREFYRQNFIEPYREFLVGGENFKRIAYDQMVFNFPFFSVPGNHDYYDLPLIYGAISQLTFPLRQLLRSQLDLDVGFYGSGQGKAYAKAFLDYSQAFDPQGLNHHLDAHYTASTATGRCLRYEPGRFTRLPNRYYTFRYGDIDFFALDSSTFNEPSPIPKTKQGESDRHQLEKRREELERQRLELLETSATLNTQNPDDAEILDDNHGKLSQINEMKLDIDKQLNADETKVTDVEQLEWFQQRLIESWHTTEVRGRVVFFHHPPYVTEATKWYQAQTLAVRHRMRRVLDNVAAAVGDLAKDRPLVDLVLNGHAHCLEYLHSEDTGHADSHINWLVCGGSGHSLRRQREEGGELRESIGGEERLVAKSHLYVGRNGQGSQKRRPYSCLRIDVQGGNPPKFVVRPLVAEQFRRKWSDRALDPFKL